MGSCTWVYGNFWPSTLQWGKFRTWKTALLLKFRLFGLISNPVERTTFEFGALELNFMTIPIQNALFHSTRELSNNTGPLIKIRSVEHFPKVFHSPLFFSLAGYY